MAELVELFASLGYTGASSYLQSGNVVFGAGDSDGARVSATLEAAVAEQLGLDTRVILRTHAELEAIAARAPFDEAVHVIFLDGAPAPAAVDRLDENRSPGDRFSVAGREIYLSLENGAGRTRLTLDWFERGLRVTGTQRNWNTLLKLIDLTAP